MAEADVTMLLEEIEAGKPGAFDRLLGQVYPALRDMARAKLRDQRDGHTLSATGLVHEAYLRLVRYQDVSWKGRAHFFGAAAQTMRRVLVDHARKKTANKRRGEHVSITQAGGVEIEVSLDQLLEVDDALTRLAEDRPRWVQVVECRYFAGLNIEETAEVLDVSHATVSNDWRLARAWLKRELS
ncbi:MAG: sigma-70 family RNA polymerase sigma factor [Rubricoccaceae bacterium]|nr:sigma-70 family RNA polymerase sigma factor [Rubricoccaceae bacterium]